MIEVMYLSLPFLLVGLFLAGAGVFGLCRW